MFNSGGLLLPTKIASELSSAFMQMDRKDLAEQIVRVVVPPQILAGDLNRFSFLAYPWPRLTYEERCSINLREPESIAVALDGVVVQIELDDFGQVNWLKVHEHPSLFDEIRALIT